MSVELAFREDLSYRTGSERMSATISYRGLKVPGPEGVPDRKPAIETIGPALDKWSVEARERGAWLFDALDPRGGIAFASWRSFSLSAEDEKTGLHEAPCVRLEPPFFSPEPVATRTSARAANRGAFQLGLFIDGEEVRFATLEAVIEFVRRVYLRSGGGDGLDGGAAPVPPRPVGGGPELPGLPEAPELPRGPEPETEEGPRDAPPGHDPRSGSAAVKSAPDALELIRSFREMTQRLAQQFLLPAGAVGTDKKPKVAGERFIWFSEPITPHGSGDTGASPVPAPAIGQLKRPMDALGWAALLLIHEMLVRLPAARLVVEQRRWERATRGLGCTFARLGLWNWLFGQWGGGYHVLLSWADAMQNSAGWPIESQLALIKNIPNLQDIARLRIVYWLLFGGAPAIDDEDWLYWMREHWEVFYDFNKVPTLPFFAHATATIDPFEELRLIPVPRSVAKVVSSHDRQEIGLTHLLAAATASPAHLLEDGRGGRDAMALLLFAACAVISSDSEAQLLFGSFGQWSVSTSPLQNQRVEDLAARAWTWLGRSLPRLAFPDSLEEAISSASMLRYREEPVA